MHILGTIWDVIWTFFWIFAFIAYLSALFAVIADLFRDPTLAGGYKALWIIVLVFFPFLGVFFYLLSRGRSMSERQIEAQNQAQDAATAYLKHLGSHTSSADEIVKASQLLASNTITQAEFDLLKARALA